MCGRVQRAGRKLGLLICWGRRGFIFALQVSEVLPLGEWWNLLQGLRFLLWPLLGFGKVGWCGLFPAYVGVHVRCNCLILIMEELRNLE